MATRGGSARRGTGRGSSKPTASTRQQPNRKGPVKGSTSSSRAESVAPFGSEAHSKSTADARRPYAHGRTSESNSPPPNVSSGSGSSGGSARGWKNSYRANALESNEEDDPSNQENPGRFEDEEDEDEDMGLSQALVRSRIEDMRTKQVSRARSELEDRLKRADEQSKRIQQDLEEQQDQNLTLRQELAKRRREDATEGEPQAKRTKTSSEAPKNEYVKAFEQGKQWAALYCPFGTRRLLFGVLQQVLGGAPSSEGGDQNEDDIEGEEEERNGDAFEQQMDRPEAASSNKSTPEGTYDFFQEADQTAYIEDTARIFWQDVPLEDLEGWKTRTYQARFMEGMSRGRSSFKSGTEQAELVFGLQVTQKTFAKKSTRSELPEVESLLENTMFMSEGDEDDVKYRVYRHGCLSQILMRVFHGPSALASGKKSKKARSTYQEQWGVTTISIELLAWTATVATHILTGEDELNQAESIRNIFWKQLHFLTKIKNKGGRPYVDLIRFYDAKLGLLPADSSGNLIKPAEARLLAQLLE